MGIRLEVLKSDFYRYLSVQTLTDISDYQIAWSATHSNTPQQHQIHRDGSTSPQLSRIQAARSRGNRRQHSDQQPVKSAQQLDKSLRA